MWFPPRRGSSVQRPGRERTPLAGVLAGVLALGTAAVVAGAPPAQAVTRTVAVQSAASYATSRGYSIAVSVLDTKTGRLYHSGSTGTFASESIIKVFIAARLILQGRMHGTTATRAYKMITQSDDAIASSFYGSVGGDGLLSWAKDRWDVPSLGSGPLRPGWWGSNRITSQGLVRIYAKLKADTRVGPWLLNAMHHHTTYGSDRFYQAFGLPSATNGTAVKQGWGNDYSYTRPNASQNTTGFVNGDRYAVAILGRGPASSYGSQLGGVLTQVAKRALPAGAFPADVPVVTSLGTTSASSVGGTAVAVRGREFTKVTSVWFGGYKARYTVNSSTAITAYAPWHRPGTINVRVFTDHGDSGVRGPAFTYVAPPVVNTLSARSGPTSGGGTLTISGTSLGRATRVLIGSKSATGLVQVSSTAVRVTLPAGVAGSVHIRVTTPYGTSFGTSRDVYTYVAPPPPTTTPPPPTHTTTTPPTTTPSTTTSGSPPFGPASAPASEAATREAPSSGAQR